MSEARAPSWLPTTAFGFRRAWYVACVDAELGAELLSRVICGVPVVLFRDRQGAARALLDRCPHRGIPLTFGRAVGGEVQCGYHGWRFDGSGGCTAVPGLDGPAASPSRCVPSFPVREQQGHVWVWMDPESAPDAEPFRFRLADDPTYTVVRREVRAPADLLAVAENALDVPHTAFLHTGLFRSDKDRKPITCKIERQRDRVEAEYVGEARPEGVVGRILSPSGGVVTHFDRFYLPSILEVEYRIGEENHILINAACTPVAPDDTRLYAVVAVRTRLPAALLKPVVLPLALWIFHQDVGVLRLQSAGKALWGDRVASTELDLLGAHIGRLLLRAERGELDTLAEPYVREVTMLV